MKKIFLFLLISWSSFGQSDSLLTLIKKHPQKDTVLINLLHDFVEVDEDVEVWPKYNLELKKILLEIINSPAPQQKPKKWYVEKLTYCLLYEGQNAKRQYGDFKRASDCYFQMLKYSKSINFKLGIGMANNDIGGLKLEQKQYQEAIPYYENFLTICKELGNKKNLAIGLNNLGYTNYLLKNLDVALKYFQESLALKREIYKKTDPLVLSNIGNIYTAKKEYDEALKYYRNGLKISEDNEEKDQITVYQTSIAKVLLAQEKYSEALMFAQKGFKGANELKRLKRIESSAEVLYKIHEKMNQPSKALETYKMYAKMKDSILNNENNSQILKAEFKYETEKKEAQIKELAQENQIKELESKRKNTLIYSILGGVVALIAVAYFSFTRFKAKKANELLSSQLEEAEKRIEIEQKATESELKALKSQMNPHFMFNALNSIQEQFMYGDKNVANEQMGNFTHLTRQILTVSGKKKINLSTEIEILEKYLELEKVRFTEGFQYEISQSKNIDEDYHQIPPMLIQPFVENSIKHGLLHKKGEKKVTIHFDLDTAEENILCTVEDNGIGREKSGEIKSKRGNQHESFSTSATEERLKLLSSQLNAKDLVRYEDLTDAEGNPTGTKVIIKIPLG
ncbi:MAG: tetratricopeptide repeat protein [Emticicia sp.]|nr:tetratricopeptide repeat protein [Emticicia sp.]